MWREDIKIRKERHMIEIQNVTLFLQKKEILHEISARFNEGKIYGLVGRNGSGKTMLMRCICGFVRPSSGQIIYRDNQLVKCVGKDVDYMPECGVIIENPGFIPFFSGYKNLISLANIRKKIGKHEVRKAMQLVGLDPDMKKPVRKYSLGMRQRLGLAQAIMENPKTLILDEPFNGLDQEGVEEMRAYMIKLKQEGKTIIVSSHSTEDIEVLCDEVYEMEHGRMKRKDTSKEEYHAVQKVIEPDPSGH